VALANERARNRENKLWPVVTTSVLYSTNFPRGELLLQNRAAEIIIVGLKITVNEVRKKQYYKKEGE
jgi:hypothetical protein